MTKRKSPGLALTQSDFDAFAGRTQQAQQSIMLAADDITRQLRDSQCRRATTSAAERSAKERGGFPPLGNTGGKSPDGAEGGFVKLVLEDGVVKEVPKRRGYGGSSALVDWLNITVGVESFDDEDPAIDSGALSLLHCPDVPHAIICLSRHLKSILGYGIVGHFEKGQHFYEKSYRLAEGWGVVSIGGQSNTVLVSLSGKGIAAARDGWEKRMFDFLNCSNRARITRVDLAYDDFDGVLYSVDQADEDHTNGLFNCGGRNPRCEYRGDWKNPDGRGRTFYVGNRKNGKFARIYEKGKELGDKNSPWLRAEAEFKSVDRVIPFDVLLRPGEYLAAAYPAFYWMNEHQERIETTQRETVASVDRACDVLEHQFGHYIHFLVELLGIDEFKKRCTRKNKEPAFMKVPHFSFAEKAIHEIFKPALQSAAMPA